MRSVIDKEPKATETTGLLKSSSSIASSIRSTGSLSELNEISAIGAFLISRDNKRPCCNFSRRYQVRDAEGNELLFTAFQENGFCSCANDDYEDMVIYDLHEQILFSIEFEEITGYLSKQMKFSIVSSTKIGLGTVSRISHFMELPRYEILSWSGEHLYTIGPPNTSGIKSYNYKMNYEVISNDGRPVATLLQEGRVVKLKFDKKELLPVRDKTLILSLGFILDLLRNQEV